MTQNNTILKRSLIILAGAIVFGFFMMSTYSHQKWERNNHFGRVVRMTESGFVVSDRMGREQFVDISENTEIVLGTKKELGVVLGDRALVVGEVREDGHIQATLVRVLEDRDTRAMLEKGR